MCRSLLVVVLISTWAPLGGCHRRPGLEETGCTAFVFAIDTSGHRAEEDLVAAVAAAVQRRLDPEGRYGIECTRIATDQIEVRVQHPPDEVRELGRVFEEGLVKLAAANVEREKLLATLKLKEGRDTALDRLVRGHPARKEKLAVLVEAYDTWRKGGSELAYWSTLEDLLETNISVNDVRFTLELTEPGSAERKEWLEEGRKQFPHLRKNIDEVVSRHRAWRAKGAYLEDPGEIRLLLRGMGVLEFRVLAEPSPANPTRYDRYREQLQQRGPMPMPGDEFGWFRIDNPIAFLNLKTPAELERLDVQQSPYVVEKLTDEHYVLAKLDPEHGLLQSENWQLCKATVSRDWAGRPSIDFELDTAGGSLFGELTRKNIDKCVCILVDDVAYSAPNIRTKITTRGQITGDFLLDKVRYLARVLEGRLPARLKFPPVSERVVDPQP